MAEVRPIPSAVGAFEAQVFDMGKTYRTLTTMQAAQRKSQLEAKKQADKTLAELGNLKAAGRSQDIEYLNGLNNELVNYFSENREKIEPGTAEFKKFNELKSNFIYETEKSKNEKDKEVRFATYASANASKFMLSDAAKEIIEIQKLPINDQRRSEFKKTIDDRELSIDELDLPNLDKFAKFDETTLNRNIIANARPFRVNAVEFNKNFKGLKSPYPITITNSTQITDPYTIIREYVTEYAQTPDTGNTYAKQYYTLTDEEKKAYSEELKAMRDIFKAAGAGDMVNLSFEDDQTEGISNPFEYGLYVNLKRNLPRDLGEQVSTAVGNLFRPRGGRGGRRAADGGIPIDNEMINQIESDSFNADDWTGRINLYAGEISTTGEFGVAPFNATVRNDKTATSVTRTFLTGADDKFITDENEASKVARKRAIKKDAVSGYYFTEEIKKYDFRKSNPNWKDEVAKMWQDAESAQYDVDAKNEIRRLRKATTEKGGTSTGRAIRR